MNETAFADRLVDLVNSALHDGPEMLAQVATSFDEDTMITDIKQYSYSGEQHVDFTTRRGDIFMVTVTHVREGARMTEPEPTTAETVLAAFPELRDKDPGYAEYLDRLDRDAERGLAQFYADMARLEEETK